MKPLNPPLLAFLGVAAAISTSAIAQRAEPDGPNGDARAGVFAVRRFGALGNGFRDDAAAIQAAVDAIKAAGRGKLLFDPGGVYRLGRPIILREVADVEIDGQGATLKCLDRLTLKTWQGDTLSLHKCRNVRIHDLTLDGNRTFRGPAKSENPQTIRLAGCTEFQIYNCRFRDSVCDDIFFWAIEPKDPSTASIGGRIWNCTFDGAYRSAISVVHAASLRIDHNVFRNCRGTDPKAGIDVEPNSGDAIGITHDVDVESNAFHNCGTAVAVQGIASPTRIAIVDNRVSGCTFGILCRGERCVIRGNILDGAGITAESSDAAVVDGNTIRGFANSAIFLDTYGVATPAGHTVIRNTIIDCGNPKAPAIDAIYSGGATLIDGNVVRTTTSPQRAWKAIRTGPSCILGTNYQFGIGAQDGVVPKGE